VRESGLWLEAWAGLIFGLSLKRFLRLRVEDSGAGYFWIGPQKQDFGLESKEALPARFYFTGPRRLPGVRDEASALP
jgi:hypothetical protein